jgi:hypothetical protein
MKRYSHRLLALVFVAQFLACAGAESARAANLESQIGNRQIPRR